jgi:putative sterol carrier protein
LRAFFRNWLSTLNHSSLPILTKSHNLHVCLQAEKEKLLFVIKDGTILPVEMNKQADVTISANDEMLIKLLTGQVHLRKLISENQISVQASFRSVLLLESVFQLAQLKKV